MKRAIVAALAIGAVMAGLGVWLLTSNASASGQKTFTLDGHQTAMQLVDQSPTGDSAGDFGVLAGDLTRDGRAAGKYQGYCVQIDTEGHSQCTFTVALSDGQLQIASGYGAGVNAEDVTQEPIVGGSGAYSKARGYAEGRETSDTDIQWTVHLEG